MIPAPVRVVRKLVDAARKWGRSRYRLRQIVDSKSAKPAAAEKAKETHVKDTHALESAVNDLEVVFRDYSRQTPKGQKKQFPWREVLTGVAGLAGALDKALPANQRMGPPVVIDAHGESVPKS